MHAHGQGRRTGRRFWVSAAVALAAILAGTLLAASSASGSDDSCTATGSNLNGGQARNVFCGTSGDDVLKGNRGDDELRGFGGSDDLQGGADDDEVLGGSGDDRLNGGTGGDDLSGGAGNDTLELRDGDLDGFPGCGSGSDDLLDLDLVDAAVFLSLGLTLLGGCETTRFAAVNEGPNVVIARRALRVSEDGRTAVRLRCPASLRQPSRCRGRLRLQLANRRSLRRRAPRMRYSLRPGRSRRISVRLSRLDRRTLRQRRRARGVVTSVENGQHGKKTTTQTVRLRARR